MKPSKSIRMTVGVAAVTAAAFGGVVVGTSAGASSPGASDVEVRQPESASAQLTVRPEASCAGGWAKVVVGILSLNPDLYDEGAGDVLRNC